MSANLMKILFLTVALCGFVVPNLQAQAAAGTSYVVVYKEEGFRGESEKILIGQYGTLEARWKDQIKSVSLVGEVRAELFDKEQFGGKKVTVESNMYKLPGDMRGETASLKVEPFSCSYAIAYKDPVYKGDSRQFPVGEYPTLSDDGWEGMESIELCGQVAVTLFSEPNFQGLSATLDTDSIDLGKFKKKPKSMKVEPR